MEANFILKTALMLQKWRKVVAYANQIEYVL
ncbi:hypothetical protein swp_0871 [Shewanella piezotolerans WP3]|uniref:Uncharacterized protein n=1 Tax=Shewanella piezotolerans (strain WP3 / JCM 13877) TaxID=225849 RepID=B8CJX6_SHEPW|nr:hypothetical protein swp_0871 [Shewanella piezotolerans WP3]